MRLLLAVLLGVLGLSLVAGSHRARWSATARPMKTTAPHASYAAAATTTTKPTSAAASLTRWRSSLFARTMTLYKQTEVARGALGEPEGWRRFDLFDPFLTCPDGKAPVRYGATGDGGKLLCADVLAEPGCVVYSLGSNGDFAFEEDILARTQCSVVTFDCTSTAKTISTRHQFVHKCLGSDKRMADDPASWVTLEAAMASLGHRRLSLLKIDVEGAEYDVLAAWSQDSPVLPRQIAMELHYDGIYSGTRASNNPADTSNLLWPLHKMRLTDLALFMSHVAGAGYGIVSREDNALCQHCSEVTLLRV